MRAKQVLVSGTWQRPISTGRRRAALVGALALWSAGGTAFASTQPVVVQGEHVNVRSRPSTAGEVIAQVNTGDVLAMLDKVPSANANAGDPTSWARITLPTRVPVWVHGDYVQGNAVKATRLNLRSGPGENYSILGHLEEGQKIKRLAQKGLWVEIAPPVQAEAYIAADFIAPQPTQAVAAAPVAPAPVAVPVPIVATPRPVSVAAPAAPQPGPLATATVAPSIPALPPAIKTQVPPTPPPPVVATAPKAIASVPAPRTVPPNSSPITPSAVVSATPPKPLPAAREVNDSAPAIAAIPTDNSVHSTTAVPEPPPAMVVAALPQKDTPSSAPSAREPLPPDETVAPANKNVRHWVQWERPRSEPKNEFSVGYRFGLHLSANFRDAGNYALPTMPAGQYDNGFVQTSSRGTTDGYTWNWGYRDPSQYDVANDQLLMTRSAFVQGAAVNRDTSNNEMQHGLEVGYHRTLLAEVDGPVRVGFEAAFNFTPMSFNSRWSQTVDVHQEHSAYPLQGVHLPPSPYAGTYSGPGTMIQDNPQALSPTTVANGATVSSFRSLDADMYGLRFGPRVSGELCRRLAAMFDFGFALAIIDGDFRYTDNFQGALPTSQVSGHSEHLSALPGWYLGAGLRYAMTDRVGLFYQLQFQSCGDYTHTVDGRRVNLNLNAGIFQTIGISCSF